MSSPASASAPASLPAVVERPSAPSTLITLAPFLIVIGIFYFLVIRPQQKQQKDTEKMLVALKRGDRVVTSGGMHGTIVDFKDAEKAVVLEAAPNVRLTVNRSAIATVRREAQPPAHAGK